MEKAQVETHTVTATLTVSVDGVSKMLSAAADTDGSGWTLARGLVRAVAEDANGWAFAQQGLPEDY